MFDSKAAVYGTPFFTLKDAMAVRTFKRITNDPQTTISQNPEDFTLMCVGEFDDEIGKIKGQNPISVVNAAALKEFDETTKVDKYVGNKEKLEVK